MGGNVLGKLRRHNMATCSAIDTGQDSKMVESIVLSVLAITASSNKRTSMSISVILRARR